MGEIIELDRTRRPRRPPGDLECQLRQADLEEAVRLRRVAHEALAALREKQDYICWFLLNDLPAEPGLRSARLVLVNRPPRQLKGASYYRLVVR